ncbi:Stage II sporulation protein E (SpoIIE) [Actinacidiphila yanglinensis]|uniref:Stage II sporulation protein E (SpoIIE) n=2 Tax=Actinacidiphila yanglinensis TaxID=310779 RepID=A0A1H6C9R2_9ACTN|nr:Stage II sporulation protein E (SpoIIE) [Actinacidiphila yanglinensis]
MLRRSRADRPPAPERSQSPAAPGDGEADRVDQDAEPDVMPAADGGSDTGSSLLPVAMDRPSAPLSLTVLPYAVMAVVALVDGIGGASVGLLPLVALGPAFAGLVGSWVRTAVIGALAVAVVCALGAVDGLFAERRGFAAIGAVLGVTIAAVIAAVTRQRREAELANVRSIAEVAQRVLLRPVPRRAGPLRAAVSYTSAVTEARIGGDLYEVVSSPAGVRVIIGDVQGKGLDAVETAAVVLGAFREAAHDEKTLTGVGERVERAADRTLGGEKFVTAVIAEIRPMGGTTLLNFGHPPPMIVGPRGQVRFPEPPAYSLPLGLGLRQDQPPLPFEVDFHPGDQMLLYTDGVTEARDRSGTFYPLGERAHVLADRDPQRALEALRADLIRHTGGPLHDDAAMLLLRYQDAGDPSRPARADAATGDGGDAVGD